MGECRNCGKTTLRDLGFIGEVAPFFLKRVLNLEYDLAPSGNPLKRLLRSIGTFSNLSQKIYGKSILVQLQICESCSFIQTELPFAEEALARLYADYRSDGYNLERTKYEPEYTAIAQQVGSGTMEVQNRTASLTRWLEAKVATGADFSMLDYGGADGKFLPQLVGKKHVFDISDIAPAKDVVRIRDESQLESYSYIQIAHVLEHVSHPLVLTKKAACFLRPSGYLYIEVPQDLSDSVRDRLAHGDERLRVPIHEHINQYSSKSVQEHLRAAGLTIEAVQTEDVDLGWIKSKVIRGLGKKA